jgi:hypothetical protein
MVLLVFAFMIFRYLLSTYTGYIDRRFNIAAAPFNFHFARKEFLLRQEIVTQ